MIQFEDKKGDIYQILSFCLGYLKNKILILLKVFLNEKKFTPKPELIIQLAKQQQTCQQYVTLLRDTKQILIKKEDQILYQRFVYRIKQLVRNYLPHASVSHQLFVYLKKIETYSFKQNYKFQDYIVYILEQNPINLQKQIQAEMQQLKNSKPLKRHSPRRYQKLSPEQAFNRISPVRDFKKLSLLTKLQQIDSHSKTIRNDYNRPIDIFNKNIKPIADCLNCDISMIRGIYFNLQRQKQSCTISKNISQALSNNNKIVKQIEEQMLSQNRFIKQTVKIFDRQYAKYTIRLQREPNQFKRQRKRCQTADGTRREFNFSILPQTERQVIHKMKPRTETRNKFQTIMNYPTEEQKLQLYNEIQRRKNTVLKMKSICISANKGHLELCSQSKDQSKKLSLTFANLKKAMNRNNSRNAAVNLKKKYEIFLNSCTQIDPTEIQLESNRTISTQQTNSRNYRSTISHTQKIQWSELTPVKKGSKQHNIEIELSLPFSESKQAINIQFSQTHHKNTIIRRQANGRLLEQKGKLSQTMGKFNTIQNEFENTIKNVMKGGNVNHRNYANLQHRQKRLFQTLNPQLTVKTIRKT